MLKLILALFDRRPKRDPNLRAGKAQDQPAVLNCLGYGLMRL